MVAFVDSGESISATRNWQSPRKISTLRTTATWWALAPLPTPSPRPPKPNCQETY